MWPFFLFFFHKLHRLRVFSSNTMKFRILVENCVLILTKVFVFKFDLWLALVSNFKSSSCHNFGFWHSKFQECYVIGMCYIIKVVIEWKIIHLVALKSNFKILNYHKRFQCIFCGIIRLKIYLVALESNFQPSNLYIMLFKSHYFASTKSVRNGVSIQAKLNEKYTLLALEINFQYFNCHQL